MERVPWIHHFLTWSTIQPIALRGRKRELPVSRGLGIHWESTGIITGIELVGIQVQDAALDMTRGERMDLRVKLTQKRPLTWTGVGYFIVMDTSAWRLKAFSSQSDQLYLTLVTKMASGHSQTQRPPPSHRRQPWKRLRQVDGRWRWEEPVQWRMGC